MPWSPRYDCRVWPRTKGEGNEGVEEREHQRTANEARKGKEEKEKASGRKTTVSQKRVLQACPFQKAHGWLPRVLRPDAVCGERTESKLDVTLLEHVPRWATLETKSCQLGNAVQQPTAAARISVDVLQSYLRTRLRSSPIPYAPPYVAPPRSFATRT